MLNKKILVIGDMHLGRISYSEYIKDNRIKEKNDVFDFIVKCAEGVDTVVFLGDNFNTKTPSADTIKEFTNFVERFDGKRVFILAGNHELQATGKSSIDYLKEIKNKNWKIITNEVYSEDGLVFCPFFSANFLQAENNNAAIDMIMDKLPDGDMLFTHLAISGCKTISGILVDDFVEPVLPKDVLSKKYKKVFAGHIHHWGIYDNIILSGSIFNNEVGETQKYVWEVSGDYEYKKIELPGRKLVKLENPTIDDIKKLDNDSIVKIVISDENIKTTLLDMKETLVNVLGENGAFMITEKTKKERVRAHYGDGESVADMGVDKLLEIYSEQKSVDLSKLKNGFQLITDDSNKDNNRGGSEELYA